jgi:GWxTD domain-containing protein
MKKSHIILLLLILLASRLLAAKQMRLNVDWAVFQLDQDSLLVEIYYGIPQADLQYQYTNGQYSAFTLGRLQVYSGDLLTNRFVWKNQDMVQDTSELSVGRNIIDRVGFPFAPGQYRCQFVLQDLNDPSKADSVSWNMSLSLPASDAPYLSDIEIASSIMAGGDTARSPFYKNTLVVVPNPSLVFSGENPALFFYVEAYNLPNDQLREGYLVNYSVTDLQGKREVHFPQKSIHKTRAVQRSVEFGMLNVGKLKSGAYLLKVNIETPLHTSIAEQSRKFFVYQKSDLTAGTEQVGAANTPLARVVQELDSTQVEQEFLMVSYLMDRDEKKVWSQVRTVLGKRKFLSQFWLSKNPAPDLDASAYRQEFLTRAKYANLNFRMMTKAGWTTDRGRVYMVYGAPSDVERHPNEPNFYPFEIWHYNELQNGVIFVFADFDGHGNYRLLHSNLLGELQDPNYMSSIEKGF